MRKETIFGLLAGIAWVAAWVAAWTGVGFNVANENNGAALAFSVLGLVTNVIPPCVGVHLLRSDQTMFANRERTVVRVHLGVGGFLLLLFAIATVTFAVNPAAVAFLSWSAALLGIFDVIVAFHALFLMCAYNDAVTGDYRSVDPGHTSRRQRYGV